MRPSTLASRRSRVELAPPLTVHKVDHVCCGAKQIQSRRYSRLPDSSTRRPRPKIAAEFEPRRRTRPVSGALTQELDLQAPAKRRRCGAGVISLRTTLVPLFCALLRVSLNFSRWPPAADPHLEGGPAITPSTRRLGTRADSHHITPPSPWPSSNPSSSSRFSAPSWECTVRDSVL